MLICHDCGRMLPGAENKFKFEEPGQPGPVHVCQTCGTKRLKAAEPPRKDKPAKPAQAAE